LNSAFQCNRALEAKLAVFDKTVVSLGSVFVESKKPSLAPGSEWAKARKGKERKKEAEIAASESFRARKRRTREEAGPAKKISAEKKDAGKRRKPPKKSELQRENRAVEACGGKQSCYGIADPGKVEEASGDKRACEPG
jgi:hypothetical protein